MKKLSFSLLLLLAAVICVSLIACTEEAPKTTTATTTAVTTSTATTSSQDFGTLTVENIEGLKEGSSKKIEAVFSIPELSEEITYTFEGNDIKIEDGKVIALVGDKTVTVTATTLHHTATFTVTTKTDRGTLSIDTVFAWVDYPAASFFPTFSLPEYKETLTYEYDTTALTLDTQTCKITALKAGNYKVKATSENFSETFTVIIENVKRDSKSSAANFSGQANDRLSQWNEKGTDGKTTLFIGDSFFDTAFWSNFYSSSYPNKDALCLGISATTTYDWEDWITTGWLSKTAPKNIVMHMGTNNVYDDGDGINSALSALQRMFTLMHEQFPDTPIYWFGISQRAYDNTKIGYVSSINKQMKKWCDAQDFITYIDTPSELTNDMLKDQIHPKVENYTVFTKALAKTDIVIEDVDFSKITEIKDITFKTSQTIAAGTALKAVNYRGSDLVDGYVLTGKLEITKKTTNSHVQFGILDNGNERILLWDHTSSGQFRLCIPYDTASVPAEDIYTLTNDGPLVIEWKIVYHENNLYFFIDGELKLVYAAINNSKGTPLKLGSEATDCRFYEMSALTAEDDAEEYNAVIESMSDIIDTYKNKTSYEKIRA